MSPQRKKFVLQLRKLIPQLKDREQHEVHLITVHARYGNYQLIIGRDGDSIEINGEIHHLIASPETLAPLPSREQIEQHMKNTVIMSEVKIHFLEEKGDVRAKEVINMAGTHGEKILMNLYHNGKLSRDAFQIIQEDILKTLHEHPKDSMTITSS